MSLSDINARIETSAQRANRDASAIKLIAVSKVQPEERVDAVLAQGHRIFGENRVQEAAGKWPDFKSRYDGIELHLIGPLQTNKARQAMELFDAIHTLDRPRLANRLAALRDELGHCPDLFIQVNTGKEPQKSGILPEDVEEFTKLCRNLDLPIIGYMCLPPLEEEPTLHFALLAKFAKEFGLPALSMGMSADFEQAILQGATHIRVGSAIFGERVAP